MAELKTLIDHLAQYTPQAPEAWQEWTIQPVTGGMNNLIYRITRDDEDYAVKFTMRDWRNRARREYNTLKLLDDRGLQLAPKAILLDEDSYTHAVMVQTWLNGYVRPDAPADEDEWHYLLEHYAQIHAIIPDSAITTIVDGVVPVNRVKMAIERMNEAKNRLPDDLRPDAVKALMRRFESLKLPEWDSAPCRLCRFDPNTLNFVRYDDGWRSVDWENSGWGDPTFEIADLLAHPKYRFVEQERIIWAIERYCELMDFPEYTNRIRIYYLLTVMWWVHGFAGHAFNPIAHTNARLVQRPDGWREDMTEKYHQYVELANQLLDTDWIGQIP